MKNEARVVDVESLKSMSDAERADALFSGKCRFVGNLSQWRKANLELYDAARAASGRVGPSQREQNITEHAKFQPQRPVYDEATLRARDKNPPSELDKYYKTSTSELHQIKKSALAGDAEAASRLYQIELSAYSHGYIPRQPTKLEVKQQSAEPVTFQVSDELCDRYGLPRGTQTTSDEFFEIVTTFAKLQVEKKAAAEAEKAAA